LQDNYKLWAIGILFVDGNNEKMMPLPQIGEVGGVCIIIMTASNDL